MQDANVEEDDNSTSRYKIEQDRVREQPSEIVESFVSGQTDLSLDNVGQSGDK